MIKTFRSNKQFRIRSFLAVMLCYFIAPIGILSIAVKSLTSDVVFEEPRQTLITLSCLLLLTTVYFGDMFLSRAVWKQAFEKLVVKENIITWKSLFYKSRSISIRDIRYSYLITQNPYRFGLNSADMMYVVLSKKDLDKEKPKKIKCNDEVIVFPLTTELCEFLTVNLHGEPCLKIKEVLKITEENRSQMQ